MTDLLVVPLVGDAQALLDDLAALAGAARVVAVSAPTPRELTLLARAEGVRVLEVDAPRSYGALAVAAVQALAAPVVLWEQGRLPDTARALPQQGSAATWGLGWLRVDPGLVAAPVLTAAHGLAALTALVVQTTGRPAGRLTSYARPLLSACLIVKDEQANLPVCLASLRGNVDELVVCDTGSTDRTVEVAEAFGARVVHTAWTDDFAAARNVPLAAAQGSWVLSIDADEELVVHDRAALKRSLSPRGADAQGIRIESVTEERGAGGYAHEAVRLFRREHARWTGAVHESVVDVRTGQMPTAVRTGAVTLLHSGYTDEVYLARNKGERNLALAEKDYTRARGGAPRAQAKAAYELARALSMQPGTEERQEALLREAMAIAPPELSRLSSSAGSRLAGLLRSLGRVAEAVDPARTATRLTPSDAAAALELATALSALDQPAQALAELDRWAGTQTRQDEVVVQNTMHVELEIPALRGLLLGQLGRHDEALATLEPLPLAHGAHFTAWPALLTLLMRQDPHGWPARAAAAFPVAAPDRLLSLRERMLPADVELLHEAMRARGLSPEELAGDGLRARQVAEVLDAHAEHDVVAAAAALEDEDPGLALHAWSQLPWSSTRQVGLARCHLALDEPAAAFDALDGIEPADLAPPDLLTVAVMACHAGDPDTAWALLDALPDDLGPLHDDAAALRAALPARVVPGS